MENNQWWKQQAYSYGCIVLYPWLGLEEEKALLGRHMANPNYPVEKYD